MCEDTAITPIEFSLAGGATSSSISWDVTPTGLSYNTTTHTLSGSPTGIANQTAYTYTITTAGNGCTADTISGTITVDPLDELAINVSETQIQTVCAGDPIQNIVFTYGGGANGSTLSWDLDPGLGFIDGGPGSSATISGTPAVNINTTTTYTYTLTSTGGSCPDVKSGSITINPDGEISLSNGSLDQTFCEDTAIAPIELSIAGGANSSGLVWTNGTPGGLIYNSTTHTLSGTATGVTTQTAYPYTITTSGSGCTVGTISGTITVNALNELTTTGVVNQIICEGDAISDLIFTIAGDATGASLVNNPAGLSLANNNDGTFTLSGSPSAAISNQTIYNFNVTAIGNGCNTATIPVSITVNPDDEISLASGDANQIVCEGETIVPIVHNIAANATGSFITWDVTPTGLNYNSTTHTLSGTPIGVNTQTVYTYTITTSGSTCSTDFVSGIITVKPDHGMSVTTGTTTQTKCEGDAISNIVFTVSGGASAATIVGQPTNIQIANTGGGTFTVSGIINENIGASKTYNFDVVSQGNGCDTITTPVSITINPDDEVSLTSSNALQTICEGDAIAPITYALAGGATGVTVSGLPAGVSFGVNAGVVTISGTPSSDITASTSTTYTVTTTGGCTPGTLDGTITVEPNHEMSLTSGLISPTLCEGDPITDIVFTVAGGASSATVPNLPTGLAQSFNSGTGQLTITGTPSVSITAQTIVQFNVVSQGNGCDAITTTVSIIINPDDEVSLTSSNALQTICEGDAIAPITYALAGGATGVTVSGLPAGVSFGVNAGVVTISGTPSSDITASTSTTYTVTTTGGCTPDTLDGTITVEPDHNMVISAGSASQTICEGDSISDIDFTLSEGANSAILVGAPAGIQIAATSGVYRVSGTINENIGASQTYNFDVVSQGNGCGDISSPVSITVNPAKEIALTSPASTTAQIICEGESIAPITYAFSGGATGATVSGLPSGIISTVSAGVLTISGILTDNIGADTQYSYTVTVTGGCPTSAVTTTGTIDVLANHNMVISAGSATQTLCEGDAIADIENRSSIQEIHEIFFDLP